MDQTNSYPNKKRKLSDEKEMQKRLKIREAGRYYREKKKQYILQLETRINELERINRELSTELEQLNWHYSQLLSDLDTVRFENETLRTQYVDMMVNFK
jgi:chromosome segregation ATPase